MSNWCQVFRALRYRLKFRRNLTTILPLTELARFDLQMVVFLFALNFGISPERVLQILRDKEVISIWDSIMAKANKEVAKYRGLFDIFALLAVLWKSIDAQNETLPSSNNNNRNNRSESVDSERGGRERASSIYVDDNLDRFEMSFDRAYERDFDSPNLFLDEPIVVQKGEEERVDKGKLLKQGSYFLRDVLSFFLHDKHNKEYSRTELKIFIESVKVFVS